MQNQLKHYKIPSRQIWLLKKWRVARFESLLQVCTDLSFFLQSCSNFGNHGCCISMDSEDARSWDLLQKTLLKAGRFWTKMRFFSVNQSFYLQRVKFSINHFENFLRMLQKLINPRDSFFNVPNFFPADLKVPKNLATRKSRKEEIQLFFWIKTKDWRKGVIKTADIITVVSRGDSTLIVARSWHFLKTVSRKRLVVWSNYFYNKLLKLQIL